MVIALRRNNDPVGAIGGLFANDPNDGVLVLQEAFWFVHPSVRGVRSLSLVREFERQARLRRAQRILLGHVVGDEKVGRFYSRRGYQPLEVFYGKELSP